MGYRAAYLIKTYDILHALVVNIDQTSTFVLFNVL